MKTAVLDNAYEHCQVVCKNASTTFYSSFSALENDKRKAVHAVYALCRLVDDIVDGDEIPNVEITDELRAQAKQRDKVLRELHQGIDISNDEEIHQNLAKNQ